MRTTYSGITASHAECDGCDWRTEGKGALGRAAQHHDRTGHRVTAEQVVSVAYGDQPTPEELGQTTFTDQGEAA